MSEKIGRRRQNSQDPLPGTSRGTTCKHRSQRNPNAQLRSNDIRSILKSLDSDSSDIENDDVNIPRCSKSKSTSSHAKHTVKRGRLLTDDFDSDDEDVLPVKSRKKRSVVIHSDSDEDSDIQVKRKKGLMIKKPILESEDSESEEDIIPKFRSKKFRLMSFSDEEETPVRSNSPNPNGNSSRSASRQVDEEITHARSASRKDRPGQLQRYFLDDEANRRASSVDWSNGSESEWDNNWERDWEEHWQESESNDNKASNEFSKTAPAEEPKGTKRKEETSTETEKAAPAEEKDNCPICLLDFTDQKLGTPASCDHVFCLDCLLEWCKVVNTCPADRKEFLSIDVRKHVGGDIVESLPVQARTQNAAADDFEDMTCCQVCGRRDGEETMLLCDHCDLGYHMDCLDPPLTEVPNDEWMCPDCSNDVIPGIGVNFLTLFSVFNEILGDGSVLQGLANPWAPFVGPNFFERDLDAAERASTPVGSPRRDNGRDNGRRRDRERDRDRERQDDRHALRRSRASRLPFSSSSDDEDDRRDPRRGRRLLSVPSSSRLSERSSRDGRRTRSPSDARPSTSTRSNRRPAVTTYLSSRHAPSSRRPSSSNLTRWPSDERLSTSTSSNRRRAMTTSSSSRPVPFSRRPSSRGPSSRGQSSRGPGSSSRGPGSSSRGPGSSSRGPSSSSRGPSSSSRDPGSSSRGPGSSSRGPGSSSRGPSSSSRGMGSSSRGSGLSSPRGPSSSSRSRRSPLQGRSPSPRTYSVGLRRHTNTNFRNARPTPRRLSPDSRPVRIIRGRWHDTSSSSDD